jgi:hypothetical protein
MTDRELMEQALAVLDRSVPYIKDETVGFNEARTALAKRIKELKNQEEWYSMPKEARDKLRMAAMGNRNLWKRELDPKYEEAKKLRAKGLTLTEIHEKTGLTRDQWYRRQSIEKYGVGRPGGNRKPS